MTQQSHFWEYTPRIPDLKETRAPHVHRILSLSSFHCRTDFHFCQAAQLAHILSGRAKDLAQEVDREREAWETAAKTAKEKVKVVDSVEKKAATAEKNRASAEKR